MKKLNLLFVGLFLVQVLLLQSQTWKTPADVVSFQVDCIPSVIVFQSGSQSAREIWRIDPDGTNLIQLTNNSIGDYVPSISPDGQSIAFIRDGSLYRMNGDGSDQKSLRYVSNASYPTWSPDGLMIAFTEFIGGGLFPQGDIKVFSFSQPLLTLASTPNDESHPSWSPDGATIIYSRDPNSSTLLDIYTVPAIGGPQDQLTITPAFSERYPSFSPDGIKIAYSANGNIFIIDADGSSGTPIQLTEEGSNSSPSWSPDGAKIAYSSNLSGNNDIWIMNADGSDKANLTNSPSINENFPNWGRSYNNVPVKPDNPILASPGNNSTDQALSLTLSWNRANCAKTYSLQVSTSVDFSSKVTDENGLTSTNLEISGLANNTTYYWRVNATSDSGGNSDWSEIWSFTTVNLVGINEFRLDGQIKFYPNPVSNLLHIVGIEKEVANVSILSLDDKLLISMTKNGINQIDLSDLLKGIYQIRIVTSKGIIISKFLKQ